MSTLDHIMGETFHGRGGAVENRFRYSVDYFLLDAEAALRAPWPFRRNRRGMMALHDSDHGDGRGAAWVRDVLDAHHMPKDLIGRILLMAQPRVMGHVFNPVSFWLIEDTAGDLRAVIAEVNNTYRDKHSYLCAHPDFAPIRPEDHMLAEKIFHVSPFQDVAGSYRFRFNIGADKVGVWIDYRNDGGGLYATLTGDRRAMTTAGLIGSLLRRPFGSRRVLGLIHWQALKLFFKGAGFRSRPEPPTHEVSR
ncbi:MAG: DUF1365 domain-containing protein [Pseudomonadota bacterium]